MLFVGHHQVSVVLKGEKKDLTMLAESSVEILVLKPDDSVK
jgi:hypothetical protein